VNPPGHSENFEERIQDFYDNAPCGFLLAYPDRRIVEANATLAAWLGYPRSELTGKLFTDLLAVGSRIHYETHFAALLEIHGELGGVAIDLMTASGVRKSVLFTANVKTGADGKPILLRIMFQDASDRRSYELELLDARRRADAERARTEILAQTLQRSLLPPRLSHPEGMEAAAYYHAASPDEVSGDFYDLFPLTRDRWAFFLGDVSGKGAGAAAITSLTRYTLRAAAVFDADPVAVLGNLHAVLSHEFREITNQFASVIFGVLTPEFDGVHVRLASGGHLPPLVLDAAGHTEYVDIAGGQPVGMPIDPTFIAAHIVLKAGDTLVLYTDGLTEARTGVGAQRYDDHGEMLRFAAQNAPTDAGKIVAAIQNLLEELGTGVEDDTAVLALSVPAR
jgi:phosphoserine phosphatase RsbU/P